MVGIEVLFGVVKRSVMRGKGLEVLLYDRWVCLEGLFGDKKGVVYF